MRLRIIQGVTQTQLFPKDHIYKEYYEMSEGEISVVKEQLRQEAEEAAYQQQELNQISPGAGDRPQGNTPGGQEAVPPQQAEEDFSELDLLRSKLVEENGYRPEEQKVWKRILQKIPETQKKA